MIRQLVSFTTSHMCLSSLLFCVGFTVGFGAGVWFAKKDSNNKSENLNYVMKAATKRAPMKTDTTKLMVTNDITACGDFSWSAVQRIAK